MKRNWLKSATKRAVLVHTTDGSTVAGVLDVVATDGIILRKASLQEGEGQVDMAGEVFVLRSRVLMIQVVGARSVEA